MSKIIVIYYSYTNHTRMIAEKMKEKLQCDLLEIRPVEDYPDDYQYVVEMSENPTQKDYIEPEIEEIKVDLSQYDTIVIGAPVWWYTMAAPIRTFLKENDLSGKTVIPYATNAGWLGHTFEDIKQLCKNATVKNELSIQFTMDYEENKILTSEKEVDSWIEKIKK